jgi:hypothetical protein
MYSEQMSMPTADTQALFVRQKCGQSNVVDAGTTVDAPLRVPVAVEPFAKLVTW